MARHVVIGSDDLVTGSVVMKWGDAVTANVTSRNDLVTGSNISMWGVGPCLCRVPITIEALPPACEESACGGLARDCAGCL